AWWVLPPAVAHSTRRAADFAAAPLVTFSARPFELVRAPGLQRFASGRYDKPLSRFADPLEVSGLLAPSRSRVRRGQRFNAGDPLRSPTSLLLALSRSVPSDARMTLQAMCHRMREHNVANSLQRRFE